MLSFWTCFSFGQPSKSFDELIIETNQYLEAYSALSPSQRNESLIPWIETGLSQDQIKYLKLQLKESIDSRKDAISENELILVFQFLIFENISYMLSHKSLKDYRIEKLINHDYDLSMVVSDDRKLYNFSLDEKTGGTYRSRISLTYYVHDTIVPKLKNGDLKKITNQHEVFEGDGFDQIYTLSTKAGTKYVLTSFVRTCSLCFDASIKLISLKKGTFEEDFLYKVSSRNLGEEMIRYNSNSKTITIDYVTNDLTPECNCLNQIESDLASKQPHANEWFETKCQCIFKFNGVNFE